MLFDDVDDDDDDDVDDNDDDSVLDFSNSPLCLSTRAFSAFTAIATASLSGLRFFSRLQQQRQHSNSNGISPSCFLLVMDYGLVYFCHGLRSPVDMSATSSCMDYGSQMR